MTRRGLFFAIATAAITACSHGVAASRPSGVARRIVSLAPSMTEALFAIGAGDRVVGRSRFCNFPLEATRLPIVGGVEPDLEAILELRPDLAVGVAGLASERLADKLRARGIQAWIPDVGSLAAIDELLVGLGQRTGHAEDAKRLVLGLDGREKDIERSVAGQPRPRVLMLISLSPVVAAGPKSFTAELIRVAGGQNVVVEGGAWPTVGFEQILALDPDLILDATVVGGDEPTNISSDSPGWRGVRAVRDGHVIAVRDERVLRAGPRIADGLAVLARALHPLAAVPEER